MKNPFKPDRSDRERDNPLVPNAIERPVERTADRAATHDNPLVPNAIERPVERAAADDRDAVVDRPGIGSRDNVDDLRANRPRLEDRPADTARGRGAAGPSVVDRPLRDAPADHRQGIMDHPPASQDGVTTSATDYSRQIALRAGCPVTVPGATVNRFCSSGLQTIALAAQRIMAGEADAIVAGGVESISCVQNELNQHMRREPWLAAHKPEIYWSMLETAETVARRYGISRERQDEYGAQSQQRAAAAVAAGKFSDEIVPMTVKMGVADKKTARIHTKEVTIAADEGIRADTTFEGIAKIKPALPGGTVAAGNASQFSDGASACVVMSDTAAAMRAKIQGIVVVECIVLPDGTVDDVKVIKSLDKTFGLDDQAINAAKQWRFRPGRRLGEPVPVYVTIELTFTLR